ncbi:dihydrofolate reductase [Thiobacter aerophilum]|uniref:Dihydrofolate reductase n=1 Tax=Thiobacter aerophilum TaxID=3121275 RepID=A0ABV0EBY2_9BURK
MPANTPRVSIIAAMAANRVIGKGNRLPWHLPEDLQHFKTLTMGHHIVMGRKTYDSIGRPLPGRTTVIVTRRPDYAAPDCIAVNSIDAALSVCHGDAEVFFVGGAEIYAQVLPIADRLYLTEIKRDFAGDARFPSFDSADWQEVSRERHVKENGEPFEYHFVIYDRKR